MKLNFSTKRIQINKANSTIFIILSVAAFVTTFSLVASKGLMSQRNYQARVIAKKKDALKLLKQNTEAAQNLVTAYQQFIDPSVENIIGGNPKPKPETEGDRDGDNARIVLDALPSKYDFPAVITSIDKLVNDLNLEVQGIGGTDDELAQKTQVATPNPVPVEIPFQLTTKGKFLVTRNLFKHIELSIRPIQVTSVTFTGTDKEATVSINAKTFYQPEKSLTTQTEIVR